MKSSEWIVALSPAPSLLETALIMPIGANAQFGRERTASSCGGIVWAARRIQGRPSARLWLFRENPRRVLIGMLRGLAEATLANSLVPGRFGVSTLRRGSFRMSRAPRSNICTRASRPNQLLYYG